MRFAASVWPKIPKTPHSSLNLSMVCLNALRGHSTGLVRRISCAGATAGSSDAPIDRVSRPARRAPTATHPSELPPSTAHSIADSPSTLIRMAEPPVRPMRSAGTPAARAARARRRGRSVSALTMTRDADSPKSVAASRSTPPSDDGRLRSKSRRPMPPESKQHSASVTARPPSEQSCADRDAALPPPGRTSNVEGALASKVQCRRHAHAAARGWSSDTRCRRAHPRYHRGG